MSVKVSIIVPVYNVEKYLAKCLESLLSQTLKDIEIICIDDKSTDNSLEILKEYASKDDRIKLVEQKINQGQGFARNVGIKLVQGEYLSFIDSDDFVEPDMFEKMYKQACDLSSEIVICEYDRLNEKSGKVSKSKYLHKVSKNYTREDITFPVGVNLENRYIDDILLVSPHYSCNKIYKTNFITQNNILFSEERCFEDVIFVLKSFLLSKNISYTNDVFYHYRIIESSTLRHTSNMDEILIKLISDIKIYLDENQLYDRYERNFKYFILANSKNVRRKITRSNARTLYLKLSAYLDNDEQKVLWRRLKLNFIDRFVCR